MSKKKRPSEEGKDTPKDFVEIPLPELWDDSFDKGRVFQYGTARWAYGFLMFIIAGCVLISVTEIPDGLFLVWGFLLLPTVALLLLAKYEIRHDREGFSICLGKRVLRRHSWSEVTGVDIQKRVSVNGKKLLAEPSMSGYEAFYDRAHAAAKKKSKDQPATPPAENSPEPLKQQEKSPQSKGYIEIDLSRLKDKLEDGLERFSYGHKSRKFDGSYRKGEGRLGLEPVYAKASVVCLIVTLILLFCGIALGGDATGMVIFFGVMFLLCVAFMVISFYEIRFDQNGFSTRFGKRILHEYKWSDVTDAQGGRKVWVKGKRLLTDHTFDEFPEFYKMARVSCKGKGKPTPPSEKKHKNRSKSPTRK